MMCAHKTALGVVDSGVSGPAAAAVIEGRSFRLDQSRQLQTGEVEADRLGHGTAVMDGILAAAPRVALFDAQVFFDRLSCSPSQVAAAIDWLVSRDVQIINLSFGLRSDREVLREACANAIRSGVILIASSPARGEPVFPAAYPQVIQATGDARCAPGELSLLQTEQADFGAHVRSRDKSLAGASIGCAHVSAQAVRYLLENPGATREQLMHWLADQARFRGPEQRTS